MHLPQGIMGWTVFVSGLLLVAHRVHGIDAPRSWIEFVERLFTDKMRVRFVGAGLVVLGCALFYYAGRSLSTLGMLFDTSVVLAIVLGASLLFAQNHVRHFAFATAEGSDMMIRVNSVIISFVGLGFALATFFV